MKSRFLADLQGSSDDFFDPAGDEAFLYGLPSVANNGASVANHGGLPSAASHGENPLAVAPVEISVLTSEAAQAQSAQSGATTVVAATSGGITINLLFDAAAMAAPASFRAGIQQAASILTSAISDKITVNAAIDYSGTGGGAAAGPDNGYYESYSTVRADLINNATAGDTIFNALPSGPSIQGQSSVAVWNAQLKLWGVLGANDTTTDDGSATFATDINSNLLVGVALHELTHAMGRVPYGPPYGSQPDIFDLFRFTSPGTRLIAGGNTAPPAYFSVDGGNTKLADFGQSSDPSDFLNSGVQGPNDPFNEYYTGSTLQSLTTADKQLMDALGFHTMTPVATTVIEAFGSTSLVEVGPYFYLDSISSGSGPELKYAGTPVVAGQFGPWAPIGAEQTATGYEVAWKVAGADQYGVWYTDSSGNFISNTAVMSGTSATLESLETSFHQDLNGDGVIGIPTTVIESFGSTSLVEVGNNFYLKSISSGTSVELQNGGVPVVAGGSGAWTPIAAEVTATGYEVAWKLTGADQYSVWNTDSNGNYVSNMIGVVSGSSTVLQSLEPSFHQDLKGDSVIGPAPSAAAASHFGASNVASFVFNASGTSPNLSPPGTPDKEVIFASGYQDVLTGGGGQDQFVFAPTSSGPAVQHTITDFVSGLDSRP